MLLICAVENPLSINFFGHPLVRKFIRAGVILTAMVIAGVLGFHFIEGYNFLDALYMTVITMGTVGYEVLGEGLSPGGKIFVIFLIIFTIGIFFYAVTSLTSIVVEGELRNLFKIYRVNQRIQQLKDHVIICGLGRNGRESALELMAHKDPFLIIERDKAVIDNFQHHHPDVLILEGNGTEEEVLLRANIKNAKGIIISFAEDADNVFTTLTARELNPAIHIVARASSDSVISKLKHAGAHRVILPNQLGGRKMARIITQPALVDFVDLITGEGQFRLHLEEAPCTLENGLAGRTLRDLDIKSRTGVWVLGIRDSSKGYELNPASDKVLKAGEILFVLGTKEQLANFSKEFNISL